ncbi:unnamed protein product [Mesocestoides corti]|uniref:Uncharacterized protein n=1 Tax=Mesocestoides corti TaxID=53468 RepID=A0A3P6HXJ9_MESCO|nr:unnamed protein product [Mesocestoides corti]
MRDICVLNRVPIRSIHPIWDSNTRLDVNNESEGEAMTGEE